MPIAFDTAGSNTPTTNGTTSFAFTRASPGLLILGIFITSGNLPTVLKYGGASATLGIAGTRSSSVNALYYLVNAPFGANNIVSNVGSEQGISFNISSYISTGATGIPDASTTVQGGTISGLNGTLTTVANNCWLVMQEWCNSGGLTAGTNTVLRSTINNVGIFDSNGPISPAGLGTLVTTFTSSNDVISTMISFPPGGGGLTTNSKYWS